MLYSSSITPRESVFLQQINHPGSEWGVVKNQKDDPLITSSLFQQKQDAEELCDKLTELFKSSKGIPQEKAESYSSLLKIWTAEKSGYVVVIPRSFLGDNAQQAMNSPRAKPLVLDSSSDESGSSTEEIPSHFDLQDHPTILLNQRRESNPERIQRSLALQLKRAKERHDTSTPINETWATMIPTECTLKKRAGVTGTFPFGMALTIGRRTHNEDMPINGTVKIAINGDQLELPYFGVLDGHSKPLQNGRGMLYVKFFKDNFSMILSKEFLKEMERLDEDKKKSQEWIDQALVNAIKSTYVFISYASYESFGHLEGGGTTATVCLIYNNQLWTICAGDTRAILSTKDQTTSLSWDAKVYDPDDTTMDNEKLNQSLYNRGAGLVYTGLWRSSCGLNITRSLGHPPTGGINPRPKISVTPLITDPEENAYVMIASDGFWDVGTSALAGASLQEMAKNDATCGEMAANLVRHAFNHNSKDNISITIFKTSIKRIENHDVDSTDKRLQN